MGASRDGKHEADFLVPLFCASKPVLGVGLLALAQAGEIDLDWPIARFLPCDPGAWASESTVRAVLCHTARIPQIDPVFVRTIEPSKRAQILLDAPAPAARGNAEAVYNPYGSSVLIAWVLESVTGLTFGHALEALVLEPYGVDLRQFWIEPGVCSRFDPERVLAHTQLTLRGALVPLAGDGTAEVAEARCPAFSAYASPESLRTFYSGVCSDLLGASVVLSPRTADLLSAPWSRDSSGLGYAGGFRVDLRNLHPGLSAKSVGHMSDGGGVLGFADPELGLAECIHEPILLPELEPVIQRARSRIGLALRASHGH